MVPSVSSTGGPAAGTHGGECTRKRNGQLVHVGPDGNFPSAVLLDVNAVAELLSCSTRTVRRMADAGQMPRPLKLSSLCRWRARTGEPTTGILDWIEAFCPNCRPSNRRASR
jgi:predicted DNA-binding transcriptional regulator AlpA